MEGVISWRWYSHDWGPARIVLWQLAGRNWSIIQGEIREIWSTTRKGGFREGLVYSSDHIGLALYFGLQIDDYSQLASYKVLYEDDLPSRFNAVSWFGAREIIILDIS